MPEDVQSQVLKIMEEVVDLPVPSVETDLFASGILDSLGMIGLVAALEERFGFEVDLEELDPERFQTVRGIARYVAANARPPDALRDTDGA